MPVLQNVCDYLDQYAPAVLAEEWDNVGLLAGDPAAPVARVMTCLTVTPASAREAVDRQADLIVTHHPLPFRPLRRLVTDTTPGRLLWQLITHRVAIYSPHTAFDSTTCGINQRLAEGLGLLDVAPLVRVEGAPEGTGGGRAGRLPHAQSLREVGDRLKRFLAVEHLQSVGEADRPIRQVAVACGAAGEFVAAAQQAGCDLLVLGETNLHTCLEADAAGLALLLPGHYASERFAVESLAEVLAARFPDMTVWASSHESDPIRIL